MSASLSVRTVMLATMLVALSALVVGCAPGDGPADLDGTHWTLVDWVEETIEADEFEVTVAFSDDQITGQAPVNSYGGTYATGPGNEFSKSQIVQTLLAGPEDAMRAENVYFALLAEATQYRVENGTLVLIDSDGRDVLVFEETDL